MNAAAPRLVDAHAHLVAPEFDADRAEVLERARAAGVKAVVAVGETLADAEKNLLLAATPDGMIRPTAGLYPTILDREQAALLEALVRSERERLVAIGEVGLDHWKVRDPAERELQRELFLGFVRLSAETGLPLNVHSRSAGRAAIDLLLEAGAERVLLHAFDGRAATALPAVEAGFFFSIPPSIVRSPQKQKLVRRLPLASLLVETDSPVLGPEPGVRNEPANVTISVAAIAEIKGVAEEAVIEAVAENQRRLFAL
ncbi:MAG TPA: TatD family hydrolase [Thermoanaerobaculia bacterium]|nr:TatD family hydrolase [Thermoanaerobaculia bacterium]